MVGLPFSGCRPIPVKDVAVLPRTELVKRPLISADTLDSLYHDVTKKRLVADFYEQRSFVPAWSDVENPAGGMLVNFIREASYHGLLPGDYHLEALNSLDDDPSLRAMHLLRRDVLMTDAFFGLAEDLRFGRLHVARVTDSLDVEILHRALARGRVVETLLLQEPTLWGYRALKAGLKALLDEAAVIGPDPGFSSSGSAGDRAVLQRRIRSVAINLERWRQENVPFGDRYIYVNIPSYTARVIDDDSVLMESRTIVGKPENATPLLSSSVQCLVTYPYWHVPRRIAVEELLPRIMDDPGFISRNNFDVLDRKGTLLHPDSVAWHRFGRNNFPVILRQREGRENALGVVKFVFDNPYAVFLHDTNAPELFRRTYRALSHGCIRVEKAVALAHYLITGRLDKMSPLVSKYLNEKTRHTIDLPVSVPVHIRYFTAEYIDGQLRFYEDIYENDRQLMDRMYPVGSGASY